MDLLLFTILRREHILKKFDLNLPIAKCLDCLPPCTGFSHSFCSQLPHARPRNLVAYGSRGIAMMIASGRGDENKIDILSQYDLHPVMHSILPSGHSITCCCGLPVKDSFYQFDVVSPGCGRVVNTLYAGEACAERFLLLSQRFGSSRITPLPLFDPFQVAPTATHTARDAGLSEDTTPMPPINVEAEQAIHLTLICRGAAHAPDSVFTDFLRRIRANPGRPLADWEVRAVNTAVGNGGHTLTYMLAKMGEDHPPLKRFSFPEMTAALRREAARTGLRIHSYL